MSPDSQGMPLPGRVHEDAVRARLQSSNLAEQRGTSRLEGEDSEPVRLLDPVEIEARIEADRISVRGRPEETIGRSSEPARALILTARGLTKRYLGTTVLNDVSFALESGEIFGLVGPNGAGKTTLLRILATLTPPDSGDAEICGHPLADVRAVRASIGFMPDVLGVYDDMLVREYLEFFSRAYHLPDATRDYSIDETMTAVGMQNLADQPVDGLSRGMKQRLGLARAMLHGPRLLLLDEPASGLDPLARLELREILRRMQRKGTTVIISSHVLEDLADVCTRIGIIRRGVMECVEQTSKLIQERGARRMRIKAASRAEELFDLLKNRSDVHGLRWDNDCLVFRMDGAEDEHLARLLGDVMAAGIPVVRFTEEQSTLESAYLNVTCAGDGWEALPR